MRRGRSRSWQVIAAAAVVVALLVLFRALSSAPTPASAQAPGPSGTAAPTASPTPPAANRSSGGAGTARQRASGAPAFMTLTISPSTLLADALPTEALFIELLDGEGRAAPAPSPITVRLASNDVRIATVPSTVEIPAGSSAVTADVTAVKEGTTTIVAQAFGLTAAQTQFAVRSVVASGFAAAVGVEFAPRMLIANGGGPSWLTVSLLTGVGGDPVAASADTEVRLVTSQPSVLGIPDSVTIPRGAQSATVDVRAGAVGEASVAALHSGLASATQSVKVLQAVPGAPVLQVVALPAKIIAGSTAAPTFVVQAVAGDAPGYFPCGTLELASSKPGVVSVPDRVVPVCGAGFQAVTFRGTIGSESGQANITVAREGYIAGQATIDARGNAPTKIIATAVPPALMYGAPSAGWLVVQAQDASGAPAAVGADVVLTTTDAFGVVPQRITIPRGRSSAVVPLGMLDGSTTPTVRIVGPGIAPAEITLRSSTTDLPSAVRSGGGRPAAEFVIGNVRLPVLWVFAGGVLALVGLAAVLVFSARSQDANPNLR